ncbi:hypothetical protein MKQ68_00585 [Chitinophaga horti]|uniref:Uncharacterized protein n=1 Tax=Chitinophaga horti TaxID=2920382 RepID=A0ABY6J1Q5_9BACT|nr:hypothetical protein [Chitinophaga horti]UYQ93597.1 hypothetical protein MKQ68_00585 [Chitinophaga horti]
MEKINALIDKLQELKNAQANLQTISYYSQLLQAEILHQRNILQRERDLTSGAHGHVAVILPVQPAVVATVAAEEKPAPAPAVQTVAAEKPAPAPAPPPAHEPYIPATPQMIQPTPPPPVEEVPAFQDRRENGYHPDRIPARARQPEEPKRPTLFDMPEKPQHNSYHEPAASLRKDINELVHKTRNGASLNDQLRQSNVEVGQRLGEMGIQDLRTAIGINDRFRFIEELFRGEKNMYERSIKTINECTSLQEANNWIERELKIKEGWLDDNPLVQQFCTLVKKRFS